jgi:hypothetical protein
MKIKRNIYKTVDMSNSNQQQEQKINIELDEKIAEGIYSNLGH